MSSATQDVTDVSQSAEYSPTGRGTAVVPNDASPYMRWIASEGLTPLFTNHISDLKDVEVEYWSRIDAMGRVICHGDTDRSNDSHLVDVAPGKTLPPQRHLFDKLVYVVSGNGSAAVWNNRGDKQEFTWSQGGVFAVPMNAWYTLTNGDDSETARLVAVTNAPIVMNLFDDLDFVFGNPFDFLKRYRGEDGYFDGEGTLDGRLWNGHHVLNAHDFPLLPYPERGAGGANIKLRLARSSQYAHISQFPVGTYKKAHRHGPGANVIVLNGQGYTLMWREGSEPKRYDWHQGSLIVPPENYFHQHFNTGPEPARYLALRHAKAMLHETGLPMATVSTRLGGDQIEYADEAPLVREMYLNDLERNGVESNMPAL